MGSSIYKEIISSKFDVFYRRFCDDAEQLFWDSKQGKMIHNGEYGRYREDLCSIFLRQFTPQYLDSTTGFIVSSKDNHSTQCDLILYDKEYTPSITDSELNYFFPVECVHAVGEVKSTIRCQSDLSEILVKLSKVKKMSLDISDEVAPITGGYNLHHPNNDIFTFLICKKLDFNLDKIEPNISNGYDKADVEHRFRHNLIVSLDDGLFLYFDNEDGLAAAPVWHDKELESRFLRKGLEDIKQGLPSVMFTHLAFKTRLCIDLSAYLR